MGAAYGLSQGLLATLIADVAPARYKATAFGVFNLATGLTVLAGNVAAGWLWQAHGSSATFLAGSALAMIALLAFLFLRKTPQPG